MPMFMNIKDFAKYMDKSVGGVYKALGTGRITRRSDGLIDAEAAEQDWKRNTNELMQREKAQPPVASEPGWIFDPATSTFSKATGNEPETDWDKVQLSFEQWDAIMRHAFLSIKFE